MVNLNVIDLLRKLQIDETYNTKSEVSHAGPNECLVQVMTPLQLKKTFKKDHKHTIVSLFIINHYPNRTSGKAHTSRVPQRSSNHPTIK